MTPPASSAVTTSPPPPPGPPPGSAAVGGVVIGVDPHKRSWTAAAVDARSQRLGVLRVAVSDAGFAQLQRFAQRWPGASWAIEGASGLGAPLLARLHDAGVADEVAVLDVPAKLAARVRTLSAGHGRKNDPADAVSVAVAAHTATGLRRPRPDRQTEALRVLCEHRDDLVKTRTQTLNRLHGLLTGLVDGGVSRRLTVATATAVLDSVTPRATDPGRRATRRVAQDLVEELTRLDRRVRAAEADLADVLAQTATTLTELHGIGVVNAAKTVARVGDITRFPTAAAFASFTGTAPIEVSSGEQTRHRLSRAGDRQLNYVLHTMALTQIRGDTPGRAYYQRKRAEGKTRREALRALKRRLSDTVFRQLQHDHTRHHHQQQAPDTQASNGAEPANTEPANRAGPGGHPGATA
jgi:transposase